MKYLVPFVLAFLIVSVASSDPVLVSVFHYNDEHSFNTPQPRKNKQSGKIDSTGGFTYLSGLVNQWRSENPRTLLFDAGDEFTGGPISALTKGRSQTEILNILRPDLMCVGNHEFDYGYSAMKALQFGLDSGITLASANLIDKTTGMPVFPGAKLITRSGVKIAVLALTTESLKEHVHPSVVANINVLPVIPIAQAFVDSMRSKVDVLIAVTHQGVWDDSVMCASVKGFDLIVGGHSHTLIDQDYVVNGTRIVQAGNACQYLGRVDLMVDTIAHKVVSTTAKVTPIGPAFGTPADPKMAELLSKQEAKISEALDQEIGTLQVDFVRSFSAESNVGNWVCETLRKKLACEIGLYNSGGLRVDLLAGKIKKRHIWALEPFGNAVTKVTVTGSDLQKMMEYRAGQLGDFIQAAGLNVTIKSGKATLLVNGEPLDLQRKYSVATNGYVAAQWEKYFGIKLDPTNINDLGTPTRDLLITGVEEQKTVNAQMTGWWHAETK